MKLSLSVKITCIVSIPVFAFVCASLILGHQFNMELSSARISGSSLDALGASSSLIHEIQIERTLSVLKVMNLAQSTELENQRKRVDQSILQFTPIQSKLGTRLKVIEPVTHDLGTLGFVRSLVNNRGSTQEILKGFNPMTDSLVALEKKVVELELTPDIQRKSMGLLSLESAKEKLSRLSPSMVWVLRTHKPLEELHFFTMVDLMGDISSYLHSPTIASLEDANAQVHSLDVSLYWSKFEQAFRDILRQANTGSFESDSGMVISTGNKIVSEIKDLIDKQIENLRKDVRNQKSGALTAVWLNRISLLLVLAALGFLSLFTTRKIVHPINQIISPLGESAVEVEWAAQELQTASSQLSHEATEAAASLQEVATALDELSSMVSVNTQNSTRCTEVSNISHASAARGKQTVEEMIQAIRDIDASNEMLLQQVNESNDHLLEITKVIREIGSKTKVINEIVFQTKLLSFNASVEAARAGEHGRGFAVVAEEVGNLAQMSGNAAKEIAEMLEGSIRQVDQIIKETRSKVESLVAVGKEKVQSGTQVSRQCGVILDEIVKNFSHVNEMIGQISTASKEQSQGLNEITKSIAQLDQVTHHNSSAAVELTGTAHEFLSQAKKIHGFVQVLFEAIRGKTPQTDSNLSLRNNDPSTNPNVSNQTPSGQV